MSQTPTELQKEYYFVKNISSSTLAFYKTPKSRGYIFEDENNNMQFCTISPDDPRNKVFELEITRAAADKAAKRRNGKRYGIRL